MSAERSGILARLAEGDATVTELAEPFDISLPAISRHLKVLEQAGLITRTRSARWRSSSLQTEPLREVLDWVEPYRKLWDARLDRVGGHQRFTMVADHPNSPPGGPSDGTFDEVVENELLVAHEDLQGEMAELFGVDRLTMRIELHDEGEGRTRLVLRQGPYSDDFVGYAREGWDCSFPKLDDLLVGIRTG